MSDSCETQPVTWRMEGEGDVSVPIEPIQVLLVEDSVPVSDVVSMILEDRGCIVLRALNGVEALRMLRENRARPNLILLDLMMPVMDGWQFRVEQLQDPAIAEIPVIILTAHTHGQIAATKMHAAGWLTKPVEIDDLVRTVQSFH